MGTTTIEASSPGGGISSEGNSSASALSGAGNLGVALDPNRMVSAWQLAAGVYSMYTAGFSFDFGAFWAANPGAVISSAILTLNATTMGANMTGVVTEVRLDPWGPTWTLADAIANTDLAAKTLLAHWTAPNLSTGIKTFTDDAMVAAIPSSGKLYLRVSNDKLRTGASVAGDLSFLSIFDDWTTGTAANRPQLTLTYSNPVFNNQRSVSMGLGL